VADPLAYTRAEVARLLALPAATMRASLLGMRNSTERELARVLTSVADARGSPAGGLAHRVQCA